MTTATEISMDAAMAEVLAELDGIFTRQTSKKKPLKAFETI